MLFKASDCRTEFYGTLQNRTRRHAKLPVDEIARVLECCCSMIFWELKRNHFLDECMPKCDGYYGAAAQLMTAERRARQRKLIKHPDLCKRVVERVKNGWTPEQIGNPMIHECAPLRVCQETICRYIYSKEGQRDDLWWYRPGRVSPAGCVALDDAGAEISP